MAAVRVERETRRYSDQPASTVSSAVPNGRARECGSASVTSATVRLTLLRISRPIDDARRVS